MTDPVEAAASLDQDIPILVGLHEGRVIVGFQTRIDHIKLTQQRALELIEGLAEAVRVSDPEIAKAPAVSMQTNKGRAPLETRNYPIVPMADGRVLIDFGMGNMLNFLKFSDAEAFVFMRGIETAARQARAGIHIPTDSVLNPHRRT